MNRVYKLRRNFSCNIVFGSVSKQNVIYKNLSIKVLNFSFKLALTSQKYSTWMINIHMYNTTPKILIVAVTK